MYSDKRNNTNININNTVLGNIRYLLSKANRVGISGEGEPIYNSKAVVDIFQAGNDCLYDFTTGLNYNFLLLSNLVTELVRHSNNKKFRIRVSIDRFHESSLQKYNIPKLLDLVNSIPNENIEIGFRSITSDIQFCNNYFYKLCIKNSIQYGGISLDNLKGFVKLNRLQYPIDFQNIVNPDKIGLRDLYSIEEYIKILEKRMCKNFTLGGLEGRGRPGFDITIRPNGDVYFYGIETSIIGNVYKETIDSRLMNNFIKSESYIIKLLTIPFSEILLKLRKDLEFSSVINSTNNPYWIVKSLYKIDSTKLKYLLENT
ncbi:hypothetical protein KAR04_09075 [Candidatus Calescamantes bacterium]|nr:hypothetical protein [Candidatus Calescamantes bacterium]MCK5599745.1 hypothetical protein [bacterium]